MVQIGTSSGGFPARIDHDPGCGSHNPDHCPLWQHLAAADAGALRNMFDAFDGLLGHLTYPSDCENLFPIPAFAIAAVFAADDDRVAIGIVFNLDVLLFLLLTFLFIRAGADDLFLFFIFAEDDRFERFRF